MNQFKLFVFGFLLIFAQTSLAASERYQEIQHLYATYNQRFDSQGKYRRNDRLASEFTALQESFAQRMKSVGALKEILLVENSYDKQLWVRLYVLQDEDSRLITLYWEQGKYQDEEERSFIRFRSLSSVEQGLRFVPVMSTHAFVIQGVQLKVDAGGVLQMTYMENISQQRSKTISLQLVWGTMGWALYLNNKVVTKAWIDVWVRYLPPNGGVRSVQFY